MATFSSSRRRNLMRKFFLTCVITLFWESTGALEETVSTKEKQGLKTATSIQEPSEKLLSKPTESRLTNFSITPSHDQNTNQIGALLEKFKNNFTVQPIYEDKVSGEEDYHTPTSNFDNENVDLLEISTVSNISLVNKISELSKTYPGIVDTSSAGVDTVLFVEKTRTPQQNDFESYWILSWMNDSYVMSIVTPVASGIAGGLVVLVVLLVCRFIYRFYRSRENRLRKKTLKVCMFQSSNHVRNPELVKLNL
ncbi:uncharacterized protein LOC106476099 [Limulus polyphemus]|uniref:Uncharacterized protein LOC106476099 n=1 Tax=Limulus polyphemus TaxID=6850 RepID=A0ABM1C0R6_LIMPO|nr:uncharacterized protein LOC106476099 [Limulus polyphemus]